MWKEFYEDLNINGAIGDAFARFFNDDSLKANLNTIKILPLYSGAGYFSIRSKPVSQEDFHTFDKFSPDEIKSLADDFVRLLTEMIYISFDKQVKIDESEYQKIIDFVIGKNENAYLNFVSDLVGEDIKNKKIEILSWLDAEHENMYKKVLLTTYAPACKLGGVNEKEITGAIKYLDANNNTYGFCRAGNPPLVVMRMNEALSVGNFVHELVHAVGCDANVSFGFERITGDRITSEMKGFNEVVTEYFAKRITSQLNDKSAEFAIPMKSSKKCAYDYAINPAIDFLADFEDELKRCYLSKNSLSDFSECLTEYGAEDAAKHLSDMSHSMKKIYKTNMNILKTLCAKMLNKDISEIDLIRDHDMILDSLADKEAQKRLEQAKQDVFETLSESVSDEKTIDSIDESDPNVYFKEYERVKTLGEYFSECKSEYLSRQTLK